MTYMHTADGGRPPQIPTTRAEAKAIGMNRYFTGKPCKHEHVVARRTSDGHCTECHRLRLARKWANNIEFKVRRKENARAYRIRNLDELRAYDRERSAVNSKEKVAAVKIWRKANPDKVAAYRHTRRAQSAGGTITGADIAAIRKAQKNKCAIGGGCLKKTGMNIDHIVPLSKGGANVASNIQLTCPKCNQRKNNRDPIEFMQSLGRLL